MSINTGLKSNEIIDLDIKDVKDKDFLVVEHCADKIKKQIPLNKEIKELIEQVIAGKKKKQSHCLFQVEVTGLIELLFIRNLKMCVMNWA